MWITVAMFLYEKFFVLNNYLNIIFLSYQYILCALRSSAERYKTFGGRILITLEKNREIICMHCRKPVYYTTYSFLAKWTVEDIGVKRSFGDGWRVVGVHKYYIFRNEYQGTMRLTFVFNVLVSRRCV